MNLRLPLSVLLLLLSILLLTSCDLQQVVSDATNAANALNDDKTLVEQFVADIKRSYPPEDPNYQQAQALYTKARGLTDDYLAHVSLAALTGDVGTTLSTSATAAHTATAAFTEGATRSLDPQSADRGIPFALAIAAFSPIMHKLLAALPPKQRAVEVEKFCNEIRWRSWDDITPDQPTTATRGVSSGKFQAQSRKAPKPRPANRSEL
jgi:hypothetical protein